MDNLEYCSCNHQLPHQNSILLQAWASWWATWAISSVSLFLFYRDSTKVLQKLSSRQDVVSSSAAILSQTAAEGSKHIYCMSIQISGPYFSYYFLHFHHFPHLSILLGGHNLILNAMESLWMPLSGDEAPASWEKGHSSQGCRRCHSWNVCRSGAICWAENWQQHSRLGASFSHEARIHLLVMPTLNYVAYCVAYFADGIGSLSINFCDGFFTAKT